ncbi:short chain dehydrogenase, putative [Acanthamoeba castellanii str. Neff]|jgi:citronellol/citronellal dehydrogenase|uniref:Hydroxysteroid dehydrogenase-like protein 2 n=1 Tax=Acanthamoeba castellanii (strain ATCC 30010 / Neff) TaxID=1257118 RepID=L8HJ91_ACACF|nr:short chain dehydrogenase, putative [Acanthamoeba castellanii str. Neff]ELR25287.1 short chain dehydrogenase, putative [Acanthamoeba castellanii str. Neff]
MNSNKIDLGLKGKTIFITGASRGIGLAIALRAAKEGANVIVASKTDSPHPALPGTIYSAAKEIEAAGGKALALKCDIRNEEDVKKAVEEGAKHFGGIDICINNASAIFPKGTLDVPVKRYDLMQGVNTRGTFITSQACLPYLIESAKKGRNPHILTLSPPLNIDAKWFKDHTAYTISKFGMSMCVLGMSAEFKDRGVAVNALWPKTGIATAAIRNVLGGDDLMNQCRTPDIMGDAAYYILTSPATECTGNFFVDEKVLRAVGQTNFDHYAYVPGTKEFWPDFFIEEQDGDGVGLRKARL